MKKLIFILAGLLFATFAFAQNTSTIKQTGANQVATVDQYGKNLSIVDQFTDNNGPQQAVVYQNGLHNKVSVDQDQTGGGGHVPANTTNAYQLGDNNKIVQMENAPGYNSGQHEDANQQGNNNTAKQTILKGHTLSLESDQIGDHNTSIQKIKYGAHSHGEIYSVGDDNTARQTMSGNNNGYLGGPIYIYQSGNWNYAKQTIKSTIGYCLSNNADIYQYGYQNSCTQTIFGAGDRLYACQNGDDNTANQYQKGDYNYAYLDQIGDNNEIVNSSDLIACSFNPVYSSTYIQYQWGNKNYAAMKILGDENHTVQYQRASKLYKGNNEAYMDITGDRNIVVESQEGNYNYADIDIIGNDNSAVTKQVGKCKLSTMNQAIIKITGDLNVAGIRQFGKKHSSIITQIGNNNNACNTQY